MTHLCNAPAEMSLSSGGQMTDSFSSSQRSKSLKIICIGEARNEAPSSPNVPHKATKSPKPQDQDWENQFWTVLAPRRQRLPSLPWMHAPVNSGWCHYAVTGQREGQPQISSLTPSSQTHSKLSHYVYTLPVAKCYQRLKMIQSCVSMNWTYNHKAVYI